MASPTPSIALAVLRQIDYENAQLRPLAWRSNCDPSGWRAKAQPDIDRQFAQFEIDARRECQFPALVRGRGFDGLLPFGDDGNAVQEIAERWVSGVHPRDANTVPSAADVERTRERYSILVPSPPLISLSLHRRPWRNARKRAC